MPNDNNPYEVRMRMREERAKGLLSVDHAKLALHAQEGWDLANARTLELGNVKARLMKIVQAFKRGTPASHVFCECKKCAALYDAVREVQVYDLPGLNSEVH